ncbi:MAG: 16S rRNA (guanine(527)-N(7))-methyltransferase RsmG [Elainellaceae cyanobacterium]
MASNVPHDRTLSLPSELPPAPELPATWSDALGWAPSAIQQQQFQRLYELVLWGNQQMNLTRVTAPDAFWEKHLWDSLRGIQPFLDNHDAPHPDSPSDSQRAIDIGTGAGFPGLPMAIACPDWHVTLLDSTQKKVAFVTEMLQALNIENATPLVARAEAVGRDPQHRQRYDLALVRAVGPVAVCAEYALPLLTLGGKAVLYRGQWSPEETAQLTPVVEQLGGKIQQVDGFTTPLTQGDRHCIIVEKVTATPLQFPRDVGVPAKHPLLLPSRDLTPSPRSKPSP